jgi:geranylgeranyl diphosphate synthase, type I
MQSEVKLALERFSGDVDRYMNELLRREAGFVADIGSYVFGWVDEKLNPLEGRKGKGVRPAFNLLVHEAITGDYLPAVPLGSAIELIHNYSLVHDDVQDRDEERRGRPTVWRIWGDGIAINVGSVLYTLAYVALHDLNTTAEKKMLLNRVLATASLRLSEGQQLDLTFERTMNVTQDMYLHMIGAKTAALLECATHTGALLATDDQRIIDAYRDFGHLLGMAFQVRDDYLDIWGDAVARGKAQYGDIRRKKKTLPLIYALESLGESKRERLTTLYADTGSEMAEIDIHEAFALLEEAHAGEHTTQVADRYIGDALESLEDSQIDNEAQTQLRALADFIAGRDY